MKGIVETGCPRRTGFTVAEVMLVVALIAVMSALAVVNYPRLAAGRGLVPTREVLIQAVREAHHQARLTKRPHLLAYDEAENSLVLTDATGGGRRVFRFPSEGWSVVFYRILPEERLEGTPVYEVEEFPVRHIEFHPGGGSSALQVELTRDHREIRIVFDPFSGNPLPVETQL